MPIVRWLHLSDFHFREGSSWDQDIVLKALLKDLEEHFLDSGKRPNFVIITGDIAFSGRRHEYEIAATFLDRLLETLDLNEESLFLVPGNHDIDRNAITRAARLTVSSMNSRAAIAETLEDSSDRRLIFLKQKNFMDFVNQYSNGAVRFDDDDYFYVRHVDAGGPGIVLLGLNSAWLCLGEEDRKGLALGERQVRRSLELCEGEGLVIALMHHPFDWFHEFDRNDCEPLLMQECHFILHGHLHRSGILSLNTPDAGAMVIGGGACYETREFPNSYNLVEIDPSTGRGVVHLRTYSDKGVGFWTRDITTYRNVDNGEYPFGLKPSETGHSKQSVRQVKAHAARSAEERMEIEARYLRRVQKVSNVIPLPVIDPRAFERTRQQNMDLVRLYIGLLTTAGKEEELEKHMKDRLRSDLGFEDLERKQEPLSALDAISQEPKTVLLGDPGSGKTTFTNYLALCLAGARLLQIGKSPYLEADDWLGMISPPWSYGPLLPLQITLRHFCRSDHCTGTAAGLRQFVEDTMAEWDLPEAADVLKERLEAGGVMMILDGLDEVASTDQRAAVLGAVNDLESTYNSKENRWLVTCRGYAYQDPKFRLSGFKPFNLAPFDSQRINGFIERWYGEVKRLDWKTATESEDLTRRLQTAVSRPDLHPLAANPLQLTMMACLHFSWGQLPEDRTKLYEEMVELLLVRWQEGRLGKEAGISQLVSPRELSSALERTAFIAHRAQEEGGRAADVNEAELRSVLKDYLNGSWDDAGKLIEYIKQRAGLLNERAPGVYSFPHRSYQEYLAASYLAKQEHFPRLVASLVRQNYQQWREVALWAVGVMAVLKDIHHLAVDMVDALCPQRVPEKPEAGEPIDWHCAVLAGECLLEVGLQNLTGQDRYHQTMDRVREWLVAFVGRGLLGSRERAGAGSVLGRLGDPRFRAKAWFLPANPMLGFMEVPAGPFKMGSDETKDRDALQDELDQHPVTLPKFYMGRYPVTVGQFRAFVEQTRYDLDEPGRLDGVDNHPVTSVTWHDALRYCDWLTEMLREWEKTPEPLAILLREGWRIVLPSEAEWEKAARGHQDARIYPWGNEADPEAGSNSRETGIRGTSAVGCFTAGRSPYGCEDMSGNVWEWTRSLWGERLDKPEYNYPYDPHDLKREDLKAPGKIGRVVRGGSFGVSQGSARCACRYRLHPLGRLRNLGFRVVLSPSTSEP